ncbi:meiotic 218 [Aphomia sociella]
MELQYRILLYFDKRHFLSDMKNSCEQFLKQLNEKTISKYPPFRHVMEIDLIQLFNEYSEIGEILLKEPLKWQYICNEILYACLHSTSNEWVDCVVKAQVAVTLQLKSVPSLLNNPNLRHYNGLVLFEGVVLSVSKPESYANHTVWSCPQECEGNETVIQYIPKSPPKCYICKNVLFENSGLRRCGERVTVMIKIKNNLQSKRFIINDDLIFKLKLGSTYVLHTVITKKLSVVWSLDETVPTPFPTTWPVPNDIDDLYRVCKGIPWQFIYCLASSIGVNICPLSCFMHLKISLLLSLVSVKANVLNNSRIIHVFTAGYDTGFIGQIMNAAAKLTDKSVSLGTTNTDVTAALIGSSGGICVMPLPIHVYSQKQTFILLSAMESGEVIIESNQTNLQCAVWAQGMDYKKLILFNMTNIFGMVSRGDYGEYNDEIIDFFLQNAIEPTSTSNEEIKALKDVAQYIDIVAGTQSSLDCHSETLLRNYFLASRKERPRAVSIGTMETLVAVCLTCAKICRRNVALIDDAIFAIWLHVSGSPEPRFAPDEYLQTPSDINKLQSIFNNFKSWLLEFTGNYVV